MQSTPPTTPRVAWLFAIVVNWIVSFELRRARDADTAEPRSAAARARAVIVNRAILDVECARAFSEIPPCVLPEHLGALRDELAAVLRDPDRSTIVDLILLERERAGRRGTLISPVVPPILQNSLHAVQSRRSPPEIMIAAPTRSRRSRRCCDPRMVRPGPALIDTFASFADAREHDGRASSPSSRASRSRTALRSCTRSHRCSPSPSRTRGRRRRRTRRSASTSAVRAAAVGVARARPRICRIAFADRRHARAGRRRAAPDPMPPSLPCCRRCHSTRCCRRATVVGVRLHTAGEQHEPERERLRRHESPGKA